MLIQPNWKEHVSLFDAYVYKLVNTDQIHFSNHDND